MRNIVFINAGAGSGKTHRLTEILTDNIARGTCRADQVILTTFTKPAAAEFRSRAMTALLEKGLTSEANLLASAAIGTVHSVCYQLIQKYWYRLGLGVNLNIIEENDVDFFISQALANIPEQQQVEKLTGIASGLQFLTDFGIDEDRWKKDLKKILDLALGNGIGNFDESADDSRSILEDIYNEAEIRISNAEIHGVMEQIEEHLPTVKQSATKEKAMKSVRKFVAKTEYDNSDLFAIGSMLNNLPADTAKLETVRQLADMLAQVHRYPGAKDMMKEYQDILFDIAQRSMDAFRQYKNENNLVDYTDMEAKLLELLSLPDVRDDISNSYKQVYVDEFQDSSPIQVSIFARLSDIVDQSWWVGDPKQSIFGFRGTDPVLIRKVVDLFVEGNDRNLKTENLQYSWRTRPEIVNLTSKIFTRALADQVADPTKIGLQPVRTGVNFPANAFPLCHWDHKLEGKQSNRLENDSICQSLTEFIGSQQVVEDKTRSSYDPKNNANNEEVLRPLKREDIAILRLENKDISTLAGDLRARGIEVAASESGFRDTAEFLLLTALLRYLLDGNDSNAKALILNLCGRFKDVSELLDDRLEHMYANDAPAKPHGEHNEEYSEQYALFLQHSSEWQSDFPIVEKIDKIRTDFQCYDIPTLVEMIIYRTGLIDIAARWGRPDQRRNNLLRIIRKAAVYNERCHSLKLGASVNGFLRYLDDLSERDLLQGASAGKDSVNILTYFKAKGLEWPVVILTDLHDDKLQEKNLISREFHGVHSHSPEDLDIVNPMQGRKVLLLPSPLSNKAVPEALKDRITTSAHYLRTRKKVEDEIKRLLYVGMTRARDYLITISFNGKKLIWIDQVTGSDNVAGIISDGGARDKDIYKTGINVRVDLKSWQPSDDDITPNLHVMFQKQNTPIDSDPRHRNPSSEKMEDGLKATTTLSADFNRRIEQRMQDREDELGTCLHSLFYNFSPSMDRDVYLRLAAEIIDRYELTSLIPEPVQVYEAINSLYGWLEKKYGRANEIMREMPLQQYEDGYIYRGTADLVWETEEGLILVDYKSYAGAADALMSNDNKNSAIKYAGQLNAYRRMLEAAHPEGKKVKAMLLFYAVTGKVVEIEITR